MIATLALLAASCGRTSPPPPTPAPQSAAAPATGNATPTAAAVARGRELIEQLRTAAGGAALTKVRSFEIAGTSVMTGVRVPRRLTVIARFPAAFRLDEATATTGKTPGLHTAIGVMGDRGWMLGVALGGEGASKDVEVARRAYTRAARQTMAGFMAGVNAPWLIDTGRYTATDGGVVDAGPDQGALQINLDGPDGRVGRLILDPKTHLPRRLIEPPQPSGGGTAALTDIVYSYADFQTQSGVVMPQTIARHSGAITTTWTISRYGLNAPIPASRFTPRGR